jgi:hypothetical protein
MDAEYIKNLMGGIIPEAYELEVPDAEPTNAQLVSLAKRKLHATLTSTSTDVGVAAHTEALVNVLVLYGDLDA